MKDLVVEERCGRGGCQTKCTSQTWLESKSAENKHTLDMAKKEVYTAVLAAQ